MLNKTPQAVIVAYLLFIYAAVKVQQWYAVQARPAERQDGSATQQCQIELMKLVTKKNKT
jgi:hypothetical protein